MLHRNLRSGFVPGVHLFPGGAVDEADLGLPELVPGAVAGHPDDEEASRLLGLESGGLGYFVAAVRECFEEAGVLLAVRRGGEAIDFSDPGEMDRFVTHRHRLNAGELSFAELCDSERLELDLSALRYLSRWVTPRGSPRRYDTRFFLARNPEGQAALHDDVETIGSRWLRPAEAIAMHGAGEIDLVLPTAKTLEALSGFGASEEALSSARSAWPGRR